MAIGDFYDLACFNSFNPSASVVILPLSDFHEVSRAAGPKGQTPNTKVLSGQFGSDFDSAGEVETLASDEWIDWGRYPLRVRM